MITTIVFDFGGVLVQYDFKAFFASLLGSEERGQWFLEHVFPYDVNCEMDRGVYPPRHFIEQQQRLWPDYHDALEAFDRRYTDIFSSEMPGMRALIGSLGGRGYRLLGLSNWSSKVYDVMEKFSIFELLDGYLLSKDVHQLKPHADIYESFLAKFGVRAEECVFIDDKPENIEGARAVGMYGLVFHDTPRLARELDALLLPYTFAPARPEDEPRVWDIVHASALDMMARGRHQWDDGYPPRAAVARDIARGDGYVLRLGGDIVAYTAVTFDGEPAYDRLQGRWLTAGPYATVHRTAVALDHRGRGLSRLLLTEAERLCRARGIHSMRVDTNHDNREMLTLLDSLGFERCGLCHYDHGGQQVERIAFERGW